MPEKNYVALLYSAFIKYTRCSSDNIFTSRQRMDVERLIEAANMLFTLTKVDSLECIYGLYFAYIKIIISTAVKIARVGEREKN